MKAIIIFLFMCFSFVTEAQTVQILQASTMKYRTNAGNRFGYNNDYYVLSKNGYVADSVYFPDTAQYRFDISAWSNYSRKQWSNLRIKVDSIIVGNISVNQKSITLFSIVSSKKISAGKHKVSLLLTNHTSLVNVTLKLGLCYITKDSVIRSMLLPPIVHDVYPDSTKFLSVNEWTGGHLRGFNEGTEDLWSPVTEPRYSDLASVGANIVRHHFTIILTGEDEYQLEPGDLQRFDSIVAWAQRYNFYVNIGFDQTPHDLDQLWWGNPKREESITRLWKTVADRYKDNKFVAGYSLINEPSPDGRISEYLNWAYQMIDTIRAVDTNHCIIFPYAHDLNILGMMQPLPWTNIIYEYHMYDPFQLTAQGIHGHTVSYIYPSDIFTKDFLSSRLSRLRDFSIKYNAPIYIGEFGCVRFAPLNSNGESSSDKWYQDCVELFEAEGWSWTAQAWRESEIWDPEISPYYFYDCKYVDAKPTCKFGTFDKYRSDTTALMQMFKNYFLLNKPPQ